MVGVGKRIFVFWVVILGAIYLWLRLCGFEEKTTYHLRCTDFSICSLQFLGTREKRKNRHLNQHTVCQHLISLYCIHCLPSTEKDGQKRQIKLIYNYSKFIKRDFSCLLSRWII